MKKKPFVLFEILIAFTLVAICAIPLVRQPLWFFRKEIASFEQLEKERLADWTFSEIKELLYKNEIPWEKIPAKGAASEPFPLPPASIQISGTKPKKIQRSFRLACTGEKQGRRRELYRSMSVYVSLDGDEYKFRTPMQRIPR